ncbi:hypothetical protein LOK49_LG09G02093 [Camellia lanceoleosa]|uniref:Uncharacterized protein n=1 Tax=Camellia lanceoleosa TaxID=1840588 RepID=A0ACC0GH74_9ERIC|nr:hypothetical protein LOK49_LG09G02093 [Camellia lanceoleosa]
MAGTIGNVHVQDLPDVILYNIFSLVSDTQSRNAMSLVCLKWHLLERSTRRTLVPLATFETSFSSPLASVPQVKLVRWHQRSPTPLGSDFLPLLQHFHSLPSLDLSDFYCWTEDLPPVLESHPLVSASLCRLNILTQSSAEGFKSHELLAITASCPNLREFLAACVFDHRYVDFVGDKTLLAIASNCPRLSLLHLADISSISNARSDPEDDESASLDARISHIILGDLFASLPLLEELVLDVCQNVRDIWPALELLSSKCPRLKSLKLGKFHGNCRGIAPHPDGLALCKGLESLSIKNSMDLTDACLIAISFGCPKLAKFEVQGCKKITEIGINKMAQILWQTLINVKISSCKHLNTQASLRALEPIQSQIQRLHLDCMWESNQALEEEASSSNQSAVFKNIQTNRRDVIWEETYSRKQCKYLDVYYTQIQGQAMKSLAGLGLSFSIYRFGLPYQSRPSVKAFGLSSLARYPRLSKMHLDCGGAIGFALTAPSGHMDLSLWERFYLNGIQNLNLSELDYWPPQDRDVNQRSLSLPAAGLLAECLSLRKLFIHGTANEHFMMFLLRIPNIRDVQLREDYYLAPDNDTSTEMRVDSCCRFEDALNRHHIPD